MNAFHFMSCLSTDAQKQYAASTTNHVRPVNPLMKTHPRPLPPTRIVSPTPAGLNLQTVVATSTITIQTAHVTTITPTPLIRMALARVNKRRAGLAQMPTKESLEERLLRRIERAWKPSSFQLKSLFISPPTDTMISEGLVFRREGLPALDVILGRRFCMQEQALRISFGYCIFGVHHKASGND